MSETTGSCLCGKVQYRYEGAPVMTGVCHCRDCQKQTGTSFSIIQGVPMAALNVTGTPKVFCNPRHERRRGAAPFLRRLWLTAVVTGGCGTGRGVP